MPLLRRLSTVTSVILLGGCLSLCGCSSPGNGQAAGNTPNAAPVLNAAPRNFSGHWEKNFQLSDDFNTIFSLYAANIRRAYGQTRSNGLNSAPAVDLSNESINGLARFTEELTRMPLLDIVQNDNEVRVDRENDFPLRCAYAGRQFVRSNNDFGSDACGWESDQRLVFQLALGGGLTITHQFSLSADSNMLNVTTRVSSSSVAVPIVISNYYRRYAAPEQDFNCQLTLTRSNVCSQRGNSGQ